MIDYEKLKLCHELAEKYYEQTSFSVCIEANYSVGCRQEPYKLWIDGQVFPFSYLDDLLQKLQELTKSKSRYEIGSTWWYLDQYSSTPYMDPISIVITEENQDYFRIDNQWFPTKEALIQSQIEYWTKLKQEEPQEPDVWACNPIHPNMQEGCQHGKYKYFTHWQEDKTTITAECLQCGTSFPPDMRTKTEELSTYSDHVTTESTLKSYEYVHQICEICGTWQDTDLQMHYVNPCDLNVVSDHEWSKTKIETINKFLHKQEQCQHESEMEFGKDPRLRFVKSKNPLCKLCGEYYSDKCQHESDGKNYTSGDPDVVVGFIHKCTKCGEYYQ